MNNSIHQKMPQGKDKLQTRSRYWPHTIIKGLETRTLKTKTKHKKPLQINIHKRSEQTFKISNRNEQIPYKRRAIHT